VQGSSRSGETAQTLILVGLIIDIVAEAIVVAIALLIVSAGFSGLLLGFAVIGFVWIALVWVFSYQRVREGDYERARAPTLVFSILSFLTLALIPAILFLIAYVKLGDALQEAPRGSPAWGTVPTAPPLSFAAPVPASTRYCSHCGRASSGTAAFCEGCGAPLA
jgi:hypothetical protein